MMRSDSGKHSSASDYDGAEVVYMKDNVTIHPSMLATERISGRLRLIKQGSSLFMTWIPYKGKNANARVFEKDRVLYTIRAVALTEVRSIRRHAPPLGWTCIPPPVLLQRRSQGVPGYNKAACFHYEKTLSSLEIPRALSVGSEPSTSFSVGETSVDENQERTSENVQNEMNISQYNERQRRKSHDPARDLSIQVLEKFSLRESHSNGYGAIERRSNSLSSIDFSQKASDDSNRVPDKSPVPKDLLSHLVA